MAGGEYGIRGFVDAYDPGTGKRLWRRYTIPGPGEFGNDTWEGDSWKHGSAATWLTGTYDPELNTLYWPVGNPGPDTNGDVRKGDNLFSCSVIALNPDTGERKWHYQFTPNDTHDWDATEDVMLVDRVEWRSASSAASRSQRRFTFWTGPMARSYPPLLCTNQLVSSWDSAAGQSRLPTGGPPEGSTFFQPPAADRLQAPSYSPRLAG